MEPVIAISTIELKKHGNAEKRMKEFAEKVSEINNYHIYVSPTSMQLIEFVCFLKDSSIRFDFFSDEEEMRAVLTQLKKK